MKEKYDHIIKENASRIYKICFGFCKNEEEGKDLFQEACINIWLGLKSFKGESNVSTWIYRITINTCLLQKRRTEKHKITYRGELPEQSDYTDIPNKMALEEDLSLLYNCIQTLNDKDKSVIMLYLEDLSYNQMEEILGINTNALAVRVNRIKKNIRKKFISYGRIKSNMEESK